MTNARCDASRSAIAVIPTYNERHNLEPLLARIEAVAPGLHILFVDDNSPDGTGELADDLSQRYPGKVFVLHRQLKEGLGRAYVAGFQFALAQGYEVIVQMDADLSHDPCYLSTFLEEIQSCHLILGSRYLHGINVVNWDFKRLLLSKMASYYVRLVTRMPFTDPTGGYKCWRRDALASLDFSELFSNGYLFQVEMTCRLWRSGAKIQEMSIIFYERRTGGSKMNWRIIWEAVWGVLRLGILRYRTRRARSSRSVVAPLPYQSSSSL